MGLCLRAESWIWYSCVMVVAIARFVSRTLLFRGDVKRLQVDDWLMFAALCTYTTLVVTINIVATTETNLFPPGYDYRALPSSEISSRVFGSKLVLVVEQCQCATVWAVKACLLIMYYRLTIALRENFVVKILAAYVALGFGFMEIFYLFVWCRPFRNYWAVPTPNPQCNVATDHLITNAVFNISSDVFLLVLALQMVVRSQLPVHRKLVLGVIFGLGIFVVLASILNKYYSFTNPYGQAWTFWYTRESSTSLLVANLPYTWTLLRRLFNLKAFDLQTSQHTATSMPSPQAPSFSYHSNRTKRARTRGQLQPSLTGTTVADPPPPASLSPKSTSRSLFKTVRSDSHFSPSSPALPFLPPVAELPPSNTLRVPRPEMYRADTAPPACLESGLMDFPGASIRSKSPGSSQAHAHCRSDNDLLRPWHAGDSYLYASASSSASNSGDDDLEYDSSVVCALDPLSHHHRHRGHEQHAVCPCPPIDGLSLGLGADGWGEGDAWHGRLAIQQRQLAREHERMQRRSTRGARSRSRAESVLALKTRLGLPVELQEVPGGAGNANEGRTTTTRKQRAESLDARGRSRSRSRKNRDHPPLPLPLPLPPPHLGTSASSTQHPRTQTPPAAPETTPNPNPDFPSLLLPPPPSPVLGLSRAPPLAAKTKSSSPNVVDVDDQMPTDSSLAAAPASTSSSTAARALATADFEAAKRRAANRGCHGGAVDALLELEREILMSEEDEDEDDDGRTEGAAGHGGNTVAAASPSTDLPMPTPPAAAAAKFAPAAAPRPAFASPALVIGARRRSGEEAAKSTTAPSLNINISAAPKPETAAADATAGLGLSLDRRRHSANASPAPPRLRPVHSPSPSPLSDDDDDNDVYHDARSQRVVSALSTFSATPAEYAHAANDGREGEGGAEDENMDEDEADADIDIAPLDAGDTTPLTDDAPSRSRSRSLDLQRPRDGSAVGKTRRRAKEAQPRARRDKERDVWRDAVGAGAESDSKRRRRRAVVVRREVV